MVRSWMADSCAVTTVPSGLMHAHIRNLQLVAERAVADLQLAERLHTALAHDLDSRIELVASGAVVLEAKGLAVMLDHKGFLRVINRRGRGLLGYGGLLRWFGVSLLGPQRSDQKRQNDEQRADGSHKGMVREMSHAQEERK